MRKPLTIMGWIAFGMVLTLLIVGVVLAIGGRSVAFRLLGGDEVARTCTPALVDALKRAGFEPADVELGDAPEVAYEPSLGRSLKARFTFRDGAAQARVDGVMACLVANGVATVEVRTSGPPVRAG